MICEKCGKNAFVIKVTRPSKQPGKLYHYNRFVHYDRRKNGNRRYCYVAIQDPTHCVTGATYPSVATKTNDSLSIR